MVCHKCGKKYNNTKFKTCPKCRRASNWAYYTKAK